jgi:hypothetical protein
LSLNKIKLLKRELPNSKKIYHSSKNPQANNPIYQKSMNVGCPFCSESGRRRNFKNLWRLYMHCKTHHELEPRYKETITILADFVMKGVLL